MNRFIILTSAYLLGVSITPPAFAETAPNSRITAQDQSTEPLDAEITRKIRRALMKRDLSTEAQNLTVVTREGVVTLKGRVATREEKRVVESIAKAQSKTVRNQIVVRK